jgi:hypothetical protein
MLERGLGFNATGFRRWLAAQPMCDDGVLVVGKEHHGRGIVGAASGFPCICRAKGAEDALAVITRRVHQAATSDSMSLPQLAGIVSTGGAVMTPVSAREKNSIRKVKARFAL